MLLHFPELGLSHVLTIGGRHISIYIPEGKGQDICYYAVVLVVLTFVIFFLEQILAQCSAYAHFKEFFCPINMKVQIKLLV